MKSRILPLLALVLIVIVLQAYCACPYRTFTDKWSNHPEWSQQGAQVTIPANSVVLFDVTTTSIVDSIVVSGSLVFADKAMELKMNWMKVKSGGKLLIGSEDCPIANKVYITMYGSRTTQSPMGSEPSDNAAFGAKGIAVEGGGVIEIHGEVQGLTWTKLAQTAVAGTDRIVLQDSVSWKAGDNIVIASTDFAEMFAWNFPLDASVQYMRGRGNFPDQSEDRIIKSVSGRTITLESPLNYTHWGNGFEKAEVGLLTRNIVIRGDTNDQFGGHLLMRHATTCKLSGIEFTSMGQSAILGRYPVHYHFQGDRMGDDVYIKASSIHHCFQRCVVVHNSNGILVKDNVAYNNLGHCYFLEDGGEIANTFDHNLGVKLLPISKEGGRQIIPTDNEPSVFWITNPNNTFINNAACGGKFGYWFIMPVKPIGMSQALYANDPYVYPRKSPLGKFDSNIAHSCFDSGLFIDDMLNTDGTTRLAGYNPRVAPYSNGNSDIPDYSLTPLDARFTNFIAYKNRRHGVWARGGPLVFSNMLLMDNLIGYNGPPGPTYIENSVIIGETDNVGLIGKLPGEQNRTRPYQWDVKLAITGVETYDNGGPQVVRNVTFVNFVSDEVRNAGALSCLKSGPFAHHPRNKYTDLKFENSNVVYVEDAKADGPFNLNINDIDGSSVGILNDVSGGWIVSNNSMLIFDGCKPVYEWNAYKCPYFPENYAQLVVINQNVAGSSNVGENGVDYTADLTKDGVVKATFHMLGKEDGTYNSYGRLTSGNFQYMTNLITRNSYTMRFAFDVPTPSNLNIKLDATANGDFIYLLIPYPPSAQPFTVQGNTWGSNVVNFNQVSSISELAKGNYYYDPVAQHLYLKLENTNGLSYTERWGFVDYSYDGSAVVVKANCGSSCRSTNLTLPAPVPDTDDRYRADVQSCQQLGSPSSRGSGVAYFFFNPTTKQLRMSVNHDRSSTATALTLEQGAKGKKGRVIPIIATALHPVKTTVSLSHDEWVSLIKGELYVSLATTRYPRGELRGQVMCVGSCAIPPPIPDISNACETPNPVVNIFTDGPITGWPDYDVWMWNPTGNQAYISNSTEQVLCGQNSFKLTLEGGNLVLAHHNSNQRPNPMVDTSVYDTFEFFMKLGEGNGQASFSVQWQNRDGVGATSVQVTSKYIHNYKIDSTTWSRVRIPVADLGFSGIQNVQRLVFQHRAQIMQTFYVDNIRFIKATEDTMIPAIPSDALQKYKPLCLDNIGSDGSRIGHSTGLLVLIVSVLLLLIQ